MNHTVELKVLRRYFDSILSGQKVSEIRLGNKEVEQGDILHIREIDLNHNYTGREIHAIAGEINNPQMIYDIQEIQEHGLQIISLLDVRPKNQMRGRQKFTPLREVNDDASW